VAAGPVLAGAIRNTALDIVEGPGRAPTLAQRVASALRAQGIAPGTRIAVAGNSFAEPSWAQLARVQIVAEAPPPESIEAAPGAASRWFECLSGAGSAADAVVLTDMPASPSPDWLPLGDTGYHLRRVRPAR